MTHLAGLAPGLRRRALGLRRRGAPRRPPSSLPDPTHPAWGIAVMAVAGSVLIVANVVVGIAADGVSLPALLVVVLTVLGATVFLALVRRRAAAWRPWMTHAGIVVGECNLGLLLLSTTQLVTGVGTSTAFALAAVFAGMYLSARAIRWHVAVLACLSTGLTVAHLGVAAGAAVGSTIAPVCVVLAYITHALASLLRHHSDHDSLTGLVNRRGLYAHVERGGGPAGEDWAVAVLDLDGFKQVNDTHGHERGDDVLREAAAHWLPLVPGDCLLARTGGDEFVVVAPRSTGALTELVEQFRACVPDLVGLSAGIASWTPQSSLDQALGLADQALYEVKRSGRGRSAVFAPSGTGAGR